MGRLLADLETPNAPEGFRWVSIHGIYRPNETPAVLIPNTTDVAPCGQPASGSKNKLLNPKYKVPAKCFVNAANASRPKTWKLPYLPLSGEIDAKQLLKAIQAMLNNSGGAKVSAFPMSSILYIL